MQVQLLMRRSLRPIAVACTHTLQCLTTCLQPYPSMPPILLIINYYTKKQPQWLFNTARSSPDDPAGAASLKEEVALLASGCIQHAFSSTTRHPSYLPSLLEQHAKLRLLVARLLAACHPLHVAFLFDLKRPGPGEEASRVLTGSSDEGQNGTVFEAGTAVEGASVIGSALPGFEADSSNSNSRNCGIVPTASATPSPSLPTAGLEADVQLPGSCRHVVLSGGNYKANDVDIALLFSRLPPNAKVFGICCGFQLLMRHHLGVVLERMPDKVVGRRDVSAAFERCDALDGWAPKGCGREALFSHQFMVPISAVQAPQMIESECVLVDDGRLVLGLWLPGGSRGVQFHPECSAPGDATWQMVAQFLQ